MKYFANFSCNNGTSYMRAIESSNKHQLIAEIKSTLKANVFAGNTGTCRVWHNEDCNMVTDYFGRYRNGRVYRDRDAE